MTCPTPVKLTIEPLPDGQRRISLRCPCVRVGRLAQLYEPDADVVADLLARHRQQAPRCPHPSPKVTA